MCLLSAQIVKKIWISKIQDGGRPPLWKPLNRHISATVLPILMKFGTVTHTGPVQEMMRQTVKISNVWKSKTAERKQQPTTEGETEVLVYKIKCTLRSQIQTQENKKSK